MTEEEIVFIIIVIMGLLLCSPSILSILIG